MICSTAGGISGDSPRGAGGGCVTCLISTPPMVSASNGTWPHSIWNSSTPSA